MAKKNEVVRKDLEWLAKADLAAQAQKAELRQRIADAEKLQEKYENDLRELLAGGNTEKYAAKFTELTAVKSAIAGYKELLDGGVPPYSESDVREVWTAYLDSVRGEMSDALAKYAAARKELVNALLDVARVQNKVNETKAEIGKFMPRFKYEKSTAFIANDMSDPTRAVEKEITVKVAVKPLDGGVLAPAFTKAIEDEFRQELKAAGIPTMAAAGRQCPLYSVFCGGYTELPNK